MTVSANVKRGWLHHPKKESICLNIGSKEYKSALDNGYVRNLTEIKNFVREKESSMLETREKIIEELEASLKEREQSEEKKIKELEASAKRIAELEASLEDSAKKIKELEASLKEKKQTKKV